MDREETPGARRGQPPATFAGVAGLFGRLLGLALALGIALGLLLTAAAVALPATGAEQEIGPDAATSGRFQMRRAHAEPWVMAPTLSTEVRYRVAGVVARASVRQRFRNGTDECVEGLYVFPLPETAAVDRLLVRVGERTIEGQTREREQAGAEPSVFTTSVASLGPGEEIVVETEFRQRLASDRGEVRLRFPLVVPGRARRNPLAIEVDLDAGFPVRRLVSRYHPIVREPMGEGRYRVHLRDPLSPADRDFELAWTPRTRPAEHRS